jgi:hypothetical protein
MQIQKERFEAWLFARPDQEKFNYTSNCDCLVARFLKETVNQPYYVSRRCYSRDLSSLLQAYNTGHADEVRTFELPKWLFDLMECDDIMYGGLRGGHRTGQCSMGFVKQRYLELYGDPVKIKIEPVPVALVKPEPVPVTVLA